MDMMPLAERPQCSRGYLDPRPGHHHSPYNNFIAARTYPCGRWQYAGLFYTALFEHRQDRPAAVPQVPTLS